MSPVLVNPSRFAAAPGGGDVHIGVPTRLYFATGGAPDATPSFNSAWNITSSAAVRPLYLASELGAGSAGADSSLTETSASVVNRLKRQHVSHTTVASNRTIQGTMKLVIRAAESSSSGDLYLQAVAYVISGDGLTVRGLLYSGQVANTVSATVGDNNEEIDSGVGAVSRIMSVGVSPVAAQAGDRIVVEIGYRACNTVTTSFSAAFRLNDQSSSLDLDFASGSALERRPWVEFDYELFAN